MEQNLEPIRNKIYEIRGQRVMLDRDLSELYGVQTKVLNQAVKRNIKRFPPDFMFQLSMDETRQLVTNCDRLSILKHSSSMPYVFTEEGVAMLSGVLRSDMAVDTNIRIMRAFVSFRHFVTSLPQTNINADVIQLRKDFEDLKLDIEDILHDQNDINESTRAQLDAISEALAELQPREPKPRRRIGFIQDDEK